MKIKNSEVHVGASSSKRENVKKVKTVFKRKVKMRRRGYSKLLFRCFKRMEKQFNAIVRAQMLTEHRMAPLEALVLQGEFLA